MVLGVLSWNLLSVLSGTSLATICIILLVCQYVLDTDVAWGDSVTLPLSAAVEAPLAVRCDNRLGIRFPPFIQLL